MAVVERESTGVRMLDEELSGGFPQNSSVLVVGPPGVGKSTFVNQFMYQGLQEGEKGLYITLDSPPEEVRETAKYFGWDFDEYGDNLVFIDGYSWREGGEVDAEFAIDGPSDLNEMNITLADAMRELGKGRKRVVLDSVSTLVLYTDPGSAVKFLQVVGAKSKASNSNLLMTLEEGVHEQKTISTLNYVADGLLRMKMDGEKRMMTVQRMVKTEHSRDWMEFGIDTGTGIQGREPAEVEA
ncbi:MAG: ATPase domain-containing protein [Candidatus Nanohaloarchaea archaeon]|nr:ATPase domain-containing protein [Candidatus Nanohaloarchaea archaeon]